MHHNIRAGDQQLGRHGDRLCIVHHAIGGRVQTEQYAHRNRAGDQRIGAIAFHARRIMRQPLRLDVAVDEEVTAQRMQQRQPGACERHIQLHLERRRCQHQRAQRRGVIVYPGGSHHRAHTLRNHHDVLHGDAVGGAKMRDEAVQIAHQRLEARRIATHAGRATVAACIPGKELRIGHVEFFGKMHHTAGVLMATMQQHHRPGRAGRDGIVQRPVPVEQRHTIETDELAL